VDWKAEVDFFEQLHREHEFGVGTIAGVAAKFGIHRRLVRQALAGALPSLHSYPPRVAVVTDGGGELHEASDRAIQRQVVPRSGSLPAAEGRAAFAILRLQCCTPECLQDARIFQL
jgi:hypothetical protein